MPGCFSRLSNKLSKKQREQDATRLNDRTHVSSAGNEAVTNSCAMAEPNDESHVSSAGKEPLTSPGTELKHDNGSHVPSASKQLTRSELPREDSAENQTPTPKDRWREAFEQLPKDTQESLKEMGFDNLKSSSTESRKDLVATVEKKQKGCQDKFWKAKIGGKEIVFREYTDQIVGWLQKAGDIAIQFAPPQASLPWGLVKNLMNIPVNANDQMGALLLTTEVVVSITSRWQVYEQIYLTKAADGPLREVQQRLEKSLVDLYKTSLNLLASSGTLLSSNAINRTIQAIANPTKVVDSLAALRKQEDFLLKDVDICEKNRSADADDRANRMLEELRAPMARVDAGVSHLLTHVEERERIELLEWISAIQFGEHHDEFRERRTAGTGEWLVEHKDFERWKDNDSSVLFWLEGDPGSGKSYLTSKVIDNMRDRINYPLKNEGFAFFYCKRDDKPRDQPLVILQSFVRQLSTTVRNPESMQTKLQKLCKEARENGSNFRLEQCKEQILASLDIYQKTTLVIDALDECDPESRDDLVESLELFLNESKKPVKIFISSRPDPVLKNQLESSPNVSIRARDNKEDIKKFIDIELNKRTKARRFLQRLKPEIITQLLERCQGMFQWVSLQVHQVGRCSTEESVWECLNSLPEGLEGAYNKVWREIEAQREADQILTKRALLWVMSACKPMTSDELLWAIRVSPTEGSLSLGSKIDEEGLLSLCNNLLALDSQLKVWRFSHLSVREYLEQKKDWTLPLAHRHAASACLSVLNNTYEELDSDAVSNPPTQSTNSVNFLDSSHPFQVYTRHHWILHVQGVQDTGYNLLDSLLKSFLGSPLESSLQYQRWHHQIVNDGPVRQPSTSVFKYQFGTAPDDIAPINFPIFAMCRFSLHTILWEWWKDTEIQVSLINKTGLSLLALAAMAGSTSICQNLVEKGIEVDLQLRGRESWQGLYPGSALAAAAWAGQTETVKFLVQKAGANINMHLLHGPHDSALAAAVSSRRAEVAKYLALAGADVNMHGSALRAAVLTQDIRIVKLLVLQLGADVNMPVQKDLGSALAVAVRHGTIETVKFLIQEAGADVNMQLLHAKHGSALATAAAALTRDIEIVKFLTKEAGADVNMPLLHGQHGSALADAAFNGGIEIVKFLVEEAGANINMSLLHGIEGSALAGVAFQGNIGIAEYLVQAGADVNMPLQHGTGSALAAAALSFSGKIEIVKYLVEAGAEVNMPLQSGSFGSALAAAAAALYGKVETVKYLVEVGAEVNMPLQGGKFGSALAGAAALGRLEAVKALIEANADVNHRLLAGSYGSALAAASYFGQKDCVELLVHAGAEVNLTLEDMPFRTAFEASQADVTEEDLVWLEMGERQEQSLEHRKVEVAKLLESHGAMA